MEPTAHGNVGVTHVHGTLVVTVTRDLGDEALASIRQAALDGVHRFGARQVVLDLTAVPFLDLAEFDALRRVARAVDLLGSSTTFVGLRSGIIMHLVESDADVSGIRATLGLAEALDGSAGAEPRG